MSSSSSSSPSSLSLRLRAIPNILHNINDFEKPHHVTFFDDIEWEPPLKQTNQPTEKPDESHTSLTSFTSGALSVDELVTGERAEQLYDRDDSETNIYQQEAELVEYSVSLPADDIPHEDPSSSCNQEFSPPSCPQEQDDDGTEKGEDDVGYDDDDDDDDDALSLSQDGLDSPCCKDFPIPNITPSTTTTATPHCTPSLFSTLPTYVPLSNRMCSSNHLMVNAERCKVGLPILQRHTLLDSLAREHAARMATMHRLFHSVDTVEQLKCKLRQAQRVGENIQRGPSIRFMHRAIFEMDACASDAMEVNRENILNPHYTEFGMGAARCPHSGQIYMVQLFRSADYDDQESTAPNLLVNSLSLA